MIDRPLLTGDQVKLTAMCEDDVSEVAAWYEDSGFARLFDGQPALPRREEDVAQWLTGAAKSHSDILLAIRLVDTEDLIGYVEMDGISWSNRNAWLGIAIGDRDDWGQGYGYEAASLALDLAFSELNLYRIMATIFSYNQRSARLFEKLGFIREGTFRSHIARDGERHDMWLYGLLQSEWAARRGRQ